MKTVARYSTPTEAHVARTRLASAGIEAHLRDEFTVTFNWFWSDAIGGVKVETADEDFAAARVILALPPPEEGACPCPHCGSSDTKARALTLFGAVCIFLKLPIPMRFVAFDCRSCRRSYHVPMDGR